MSNLKPAGDESKSIAAQGGIRTYSLDEVAAMVLPPEWTDGVRWLARRLNRGEIHGYKVGRVWRMTEADVAAMIDGYSNTVKPRESIVDGSAPQSLVDGLSPRGRRRLMTSQPATARPQNPFAQKGIKR